VRSDLVTAIIVVGEVRDAEIRKCPLRRQAAQYGPRRGVVHPEAMERTALVSGIAAAFASWDEVTKA
jgi:hypothetical protein